MVWGILCIGSPGAMGQKAPVAYPEQATVISTNTLQAESVNVSSVDATSAAEVMGGSNSVEAILHTTYRIQTKGAIYELTGWEAVRKANERPVLQLGEVIRFRVQGDHIFTLLPDGKEHRYSVVSKHSDDSKNEKQPATPR